MWRLSSDPRRRRTSDQTIKPGRKPLIQFRFCDFFRLYFNCDIFVIQCESMRNPRVFVPVRRGKRGVLFRIGAVNLLGSPPTNWAFTVWPGSGGIGRAVAWWCGGIGWGEDGADACAADAIMRRQSYCPGYGGWCWRMCGGRDVPIGFGAWGSVGCGANRTTQRPPGVLSPSLPWN